VGVDHVIVGAARDTVIVALLVRVELLSAVTVAVFGYVPTLELELLACTLVPIAGDRLPNEQFNT
jgi:hypothetical protein